VRQSGRIKIQNPRIWTFSGGMIFRQVFSSERECKILVFIILFPRGTKMRFFVDLEINL
jgi:hypothetical protein